MSDFSPDLALKNESTLNISLQMPLDTPTWSDIASALRMSWENPFGPDIMFSNIIKVKHCVAFKNVTLKKMSPASLFLESKHG